jgi:hypothetical protein
MTSQLNCGILIVGSSISCTPDAVDITHFLEAVTGISSTPVIIVFGANLSTPCTSM